MNGWPYESSYYGSPYDWHILGREAGNFMIRAKVRCVPAAGRVSNPLIQKEDALWVLNDEKTGEADHDQKIENIAALIEKSLDEEYWIDDSRIDPIEGHRVFCYEIRAAIRCKEPELGNVCNGINSYLVTADMLLAKTALDDAKGILSCDFCNQPQEMEEFQDAIDRAQEHIDRGDESSSTVTAILNYWWAWKYAQRAMSLID